MMHYFMQEEENAVDEEEEHLTIIAALPQLQADELSNVVPSRGGSKLGRRKTKERQRMEGHVMLHADSFADNASCTRKEFWRCFRMRKEMFMTIRDKGVQFLLRDGVVVVLDFSAMQKSIAAMRMHAYGAHGNTQDDHLSIIESTTIETIYRVCKVVLEVVGEVSKLFQCYQNSFGDTLELT
jgi:hypothetical protein